MSHSFTAHQVVTRGVEQVMPSSAGLEQLLEKRAIRVYLGIDPTGNQLHLGHAVVLRKLQQFATLGHEVTLLIGNGTVKIGDPTGKDKTRPMLTEEEIEENFQTWKDQASKILDFSRIEIRRNGDWFDAMSFPELIKLFAQMTVQQLLERDMFQERIQSGRPIFMHEVLYPILQGYDSVALSVDLELGGSDQLFNMMVGRQMVQTMQNREKYVLTVPLLVGSDGRKMGKSLGNYIALTETPENMFGKLMSVVDDVIITYFELLTDEPQDALETMQAQLASGSIHPMELKKKLAFDITAQYHSPEAAAEAQEYFERTVQRKEVPIEMTPLAVEVPEMSILDLVMHSGVPSSRSEARRLIEQGGVALEGEKLIDPLQTLTVQNGQVLRVGKRAYFSISLS